MPHRLDGAPVWYICACEGWAGIVKHGTTFHVSRRKDPYATCNPYPVKYQRVFVLDPTSLASTGIKLYSLDNLNFPTWLEKQGQAHTRCNYGGGDEFYKQVDPEGLVRSFLHEMGVRIVEEITDDSQFPIHGDVAPAIHTEDCERKAEKKRHAEARLKPKITQEAFLQTFLAGKDFRVHQAELWTTWAKTLESTPSYRGILQWPTGTGKTFGMLLMLLLAAKKTMEAGQIFRAILIAPKNEILETLMKHINKLKAFGIEVFEGHKGRFSSLSLPTNKSFVVTTTHASLTNREYMDRLPPITHIHYDEVHRITGEEFFGHLSAKMTEWGTPYLTGTSATPQTSSAEQRKKLGELFGNPMTILHRAELDTMVELGYIAKPRFTIVQIPNTRNEVMIASVVEQMNLLVKQRVEHGLWRGGKAIVYLEDLNDVRLAYMTACARAPGNHYYSTLESGAHSDSQFLEDPADGTPRILFACEKYREGADIAGVEFTLVLMGRTMSAYILVQIIGRALRIDYPGKEGWCCIMRPKFEDETETSALEHVLFDLDTIIHSKTGVRSRAEICEFARAYFGDVILNGRTLDLEETLTRVQMMYLRRVAPAISYKEVHALCLEHKIKDSTDYKHRQGSDLSCLPEDPESMYKGFGWKGWHTFLHGAERAVTAETFIQKVVKDRRVLTAGQWLEQQDASPEYPTLAQIHDGYFEGIVEFSDLVKQAQIRVRRR